VKAMMVDEVGWGIKGGDVTLVGRPGV
jgi:hypothetical protein